MNQLYFFKYENLLTIWTTNKNISKDAFDKEIANYEDNYLLTNDIAVIMPNDTSFSIQPTRLDDPSRNVKLYFFDINGTIEFDSGLTAEMFDKIKNSAMIKIFKDNHCLLELNSNYHFITLAGKHTDKFVKTSNLLVNQNEINFLSVCLLQYLDNTLEYLYADTSTILSLIHNTLLLKNQFDKTYNSPVVFNFKSYEYKKTSSSLYAENSLVVISTSSSGKLVKALHEISHIPIENFLTLFYFSSDNSFKHLCNLTADEELAGNIPSAYNAENCELCKKGSQPIQIVNEQFIMEMQEPEAVRITINHQPKNAIDFFEKYVGKEVLKIGRDLDKHKFYIDTEVWIEIPSIKEKLTYILSVYSSKMIKKIIYTNESEKLAIEIASIAGIDSQYLISADNYFSSEADSNVKESDSVMVVSGSIYSGLAIEKISRHLRTTHPDSLRIYIIGILKKYSNTSLEFLKTNLVKHHIHGQDHKFIALDEIFLPKFHTESTWDQELKLLKEINSSNLDDLVSYDKNEAIRIRIEQLEKMRREKVSNEVFWNTGDGLTDQLSIKKGFAFLSGEIIKNNPSQADILYTFGTVLQNARENKKDLKSTPYKQKVLAPNNFTRFNDGILQASLLRLTTKQELNYSLSEHMSKTMASIIYEVIKDYQNTTGEAAMEFIIALSIGHLQLRDEDKRRLYESLNLLEDLPEHFLIILNH